MAIGSDPQVNEDLFTKIALENKLVTKYQLRKASEEQQRLEGEGQALGIGPVLVQLGFLSERQQQSVLNACAYREQRDYDKRFGRQCLRMELLDQDRIEAALTSQKTEYMKSGGVRSLAEILVEEGALEDLDVVKVREGIRQRDRARAQALSGKNPAMGGSTSTPLAKEAKRAAAQESSMAAEIDDAELEDVDLDDEELESDLDDVDLDDVDLDDEDLESDLDDVDLDDVDLDDEDLVSDLDAVEPAGGAEDSGSDIAIDVDDVDLDDDGSDEAHLAEVVSEVDSDVQLDDEDLEDLDEMASQASDDATASWTADAFDDRPLDKRSPSEVGQAIPPEPLPLPAKDVQPAETPVVPRVAGSARMRPQPEAEPEEADAVDAGRIVADTVSGTGEIEPSGDFPGRDVFEPGVSDLGQIADLGLDRRDPRDVASTASDLSPVLEEEVQEEPEPEPAGPRAMADAVARAAAKAKAQRTAAANAPREWRSDPRMRKAFERALDAALEVFVRELERGDE